MTLANTTIRQAAGAANVKLWRIADALGIADATFSRKLRKELPVEETAHILALIDTLAKEDDR